MIGNTNKRYDTCLKAEKACLDHNTLTKVPFARIKMSILSFFGISISYFWGLGILKLIRYQKCNPRGFVLLMQHKEYICSHRKSSKCEFIQKKFQSFFAIWRWYTYLKNQFKIGSYAAKHHPTPPKSIYLCVGSRIMVYFGATSCIQRNLCWIAKLKQAVDVHFDVASLYLGPQSSQVTSKLPQKMYASVCFNICKF